MISLIDNSVIKIRSRIGNTPLIDVTPPGLASRVYAKAECFNLTGSVKDRAAYAMIIEGLDSGALNHSKRILEATSGNTGIGLAVIGRLLGFQTTLVMPSQTSRDRKDILESAGAELIFSDPAKGSNGALMKALEIYEQNPDKWFWPNQYYNHANYRAHEATAREIFDQTEGAATHFVAATGTGGTAIGVAEALKKLKPGALAIGVEPAEELHGIEGAKNMSVESVPNIKVGGRILRGIFLSRRFSLDGTEFVKTEEAYAGLNRLAARGVYVGVSSGANYVAACRIAEANPGSIVVTVFPDSSERYLSDAIWDKEHYGVRISYSESMKMRHRLCGAYPHEGCGLLFGVLDAEGKRDIRHFEPLTNINLERAADRYEVNPREMMIAEKKNRELGLKLLGIAHSHPDKPAVPSEFDMERAWENLSYVICSVAGGAAVGMKSWTLDNSDGARIMREELILLA